MEPYHTVDKMINFLNLPEARQLLDPYLVTHTGQKRSETAWMEKFVKTKREKPEKHPPNKNDGPYGTKRKSSEATAFKWTHTMKQGSTDSITTHTYQHTYKPSFNHLAGLTNHTRAT